MMRLETLPADITIRLRRERLARQARALRKARIQLATRVIGAAALALWIALATIVFAEAGLQMVTGQPGVVAITYDAFMRGL